MAFHNQAQKVITHTNLVLSKCPDLVARRQSAEIYQYHKEKLSNASSLCNLAFTGNIYLAIKNSRDI